MAQFLSPQCPFCGCDPYEYVDNGVGQEPVAVTCCELGIAFFGRRNDEDDTVIVSRSEFDQIAEVFASMRRLGLDPSIM